MDNSTEQSAKLRDALRALGRRRTWLICTVVTGLVLFAALAIFLPAKYRSAGTILIEQQEMPADMVRSTVTSFADERVQVISKRVMTTQTLLDIIRRYDLYPSERAKDTREEIIGRMSDDIGLRMISADVIDPRSGRPTSATIAFEVSYTSRSPDLAAKVANELASLYLNENLTTRSRLAREASTFLESEAGRIDKSMGVLEQQLAEFKKKNFDKLPELTQLNMQLLDRTQQQLRDTEMRQSSLEQQRVYLEAQLAQLKPNGAVFTETGERILSASDRLKAARSQLASARARYTPGHPDIVTLEREVEGLEKQVGGGVATTAGTGNDLQRALDQARAELGRARERYGPDHPDRVRLEREVQSLTEQLASAAPGSFASDQKERMRPQDADNPAYVQIQAQLSATMNDLDAIKGQTAKLHAEAASYQGKLSASPQIEQKYRELSRDYDNARLKYADVRAKQMEAQTAQNLEADRKGERFTLIEPPLPPEQPVSPNRLLIAIAGIVVSAGLGVGVVWLLEMLDATVRGRKDMFQLVGVPPLALVPHIETPNELRTMRKRRLLSAGAAAGSAFLAIALVHLFYRPLDVVWFALARRFGLY